MNIQKTKEMLDSCYMAKRILDLLPEIPEGVLPSYIRYKFVAKKPHACVWDESHISLDKYLEKWYIIYVY